MTKQVLLPLEGTELRIRVSLGNTAREIFCQPDAVLGIDCINDKGECNYDEAALCFDLDEARAILDALEDAILTELSHD